MFRLLLMLLLVLFGCGKPDRNPTESGSIGLFDPAAFGPREAPPSAPPPDPEIQDYGPRGDGIGVNAVGQVRVRFTQPMVPLGTDSDTTALRVTREGKPVPGRAYWQSPTQIVFESSATLEPATSYDAVWEGTDAIPELAWSFETERPGAILQQPIEGDNRVETDAALLLSTTIATTVEQLGPRVKLAVNGGEVSTTVRPASEEQRERFGLPEDMLFEVVHDRFPVAAKVELTVAPGWRSSRGPLPAKAQYVVTFETHPSLSVTAVTCWKEPGKCPMQPLRIETSTDLAEAQERFVSVTPKPPEFAVTRSYEGLTVDGRFVPGTTYTLTIGGKLTDVYGQTLGQDVSTKLDFAMPPPEVYLTQNTGDVLDDGKPHLGVSSRHVRKIEVRAAKVPIDTYRRLHFADRWNAQKAPPLEELGEIVKRTLTVDLRKPTNWGSTPIDFAKLLGDYRGPVAVEVTGVDVVGDYADFDHSLSDRGLFWFGSLAPQVFDSTARSVVRVEDLVTRRPVSGATVSLMSSTSERELGVTSDGGLLSFAGRPAEERHDLVLVRHSDGDVAMLPLNTVPAEASARWLDPGESVRAELVTERGVYRPGDDVYVTGWGMIGTPHHPTGHRSLPDDVRVRFELLDRDSLVVDEAIVDSRRGRFSTKLTLPTSARLGRLIVRASFVRGDVTAGDQVTVSAQIKEFRTPEFEVTTTPDADHLIGKQELTLDVESRYYSGSVAEVREARAERRCWSTAPPHADGWELGVYSTWSGTARKRMPAQPAGPGRLTLKDMPGPDASGKTQMCDYSITVQNPSYQEEGAGEQLVVHPTALYLGMSSADEYPSVGDTLDVRFALFDVTGARSDAPPELVDVEIKQTTQRPVYSGRGDNAWISHYEDEKVETKKCTVRTDGRASCGTRKLTEGYYEITATSRANPLRRFARDFHVYRRWYDDQAPPAIEIDTPSAKLPTDKLTAVTVRSKERHGVLVVERFGIIEAIPFETRNGRATVPLSPSASWAPGVTLTAHAIELGERMHLVSGSAQLDFDASDRELVVSVAAPERANVRQKIDVAVTSSASSGRAAIWVVDDAILNLTNYELPDLVRAFYPEFVQDVGVHEQLYDVLPEFVAQRWDPYTSVLSGFGAGGRGFGSGGGGLGVGGGVAPRADFRSTPFFAGDVPVEGGKAHVSFKLPDNITRFRILAVVSAAQEPNGPPVRFGSGASTIDVSAPLVVRPALPRFVRPGDAPTLAAVVQNTTQLAGELAVSFDLDGEALVWQPNVAPRATKPLAAGGEVRVGFDARVVAAGTTTVTVNARFVPDDGSPPYEDAIRLPLRSAPEPTLTQTVAMYGTLDDDNAQGVPIRLPDGVLPDVGGVSVTMTSTLLGGLRDATRNLVEYPYGCAEQTSSRMLPLVALSDLKGFVEATELPNGQTIESFVADGIARLISMQQTNGGFAYWPTGNMANEYVSAYVTWVLWLAKQAGHNVPDSVLRRALDYLETVVKTPDTDLPDSVIYYADLRRSIAVYTLAEAGRDVSKAVDRLLERDELPVFAHAFAIAALARSKPADPRLSDQIRRLTNKITETPGSATVVETPRFDLGEYFHSDLRSSAIAMMALTRAVPDHAVIVKLARGLMEKRYKGAWRNTQENAYALVALADYARHYEREEPNFEVKVWVDNAVLIDDRWSGRTSKSRTGSIPMAQLTTLTGRSTNATLPLNIRRRGTGRAYYRLAMTYAPSATELEPIARGIQVRRQFRRDGKPTTDVAPKTLQAGEVIAVDVTVQSKSLLRYVAVDLPVPAGLEPIDLGLGSRKTLPMGGTWGWWVSHAEHHDDRVVLFADTLHPGDHTRTVYLRATTPGTFSFPPTHAEAMYTPEVFGRSDGNVLEVKE